MNQKSLPEIREYIDYRKYLKDFYHTKKELSKDYSYRVFARRAGISSPSHLKMIIDRDRNLSSKTTDQYVKGLGLNRPEATYFELLVRYDQEKEHERKIEFFQEILKEKKKKGFSPLAGEQYNFLSKWHYVAIYVMVDLEDFQTDPEWIAKRLRKRVSISNVEKAIEDLLKIGLVKYDTEMNLVQSRGALDTPEEITDLAIKSYHHNMIQLSLNYLEEGDWLLREFNGGTLPVNAETLPLLKEKIRDFRKELNDLTADIDDVCDVYQFNVQFFPLTKAIQ
ncbi:MAG: TIGR02147 family protein [Halobacteriovoraceae bacterium]|nr:TIGR02147 family protein [Halobacteriovoraceae bacterium]